MEILKVAGAWPIYIGVAYGVSFWLFLSALRKRYVTKVNIICLICAFLTTFVIYWLSSTYVVVGRPSYEQLLKNEQEYQRVKEELQEKEQEKEEIRQRVFAYCRDQREPSVCEALYDAGSVIEEAIGFGGLAQFAVALGKSEQNYVCPAFNCLGAGAYDQHHYIRFESYEDSIIWLAKLLRRFGYSSIAPQDIPAISRWYKGVPPYSAWIALIQSVMMELKG